MVVEVTPVLVTVVLALVGGGASLWFRIESKFGSEKTERDIRIDTVIKRFQEVDDRINRLSSDSAAARGLIVRELADYRLFVAENYVHRSDLKDTEERVVTAIDKMATTIDKMIARIDTMSNKIPG